MPNQTPVGIVVNDMLDEDRERLVECRGRRSGEEWRGSGEGSRGGVKGEPSARGAGRKRERGLLGSDQTKTTGWCCGGEVVMGEGASGRNGLREEGTRAREGAIGCRRASE